MARGRRDDVDRVHDCGPGFDAATPDVISAFVRGEI